MMRREETLLIIFPQYPIKHNSDYKIQEYENQNDSSI